MTRSIITCHVAYNLQNSGLKDPVLNLVQELNRCGHQSFLVNLVDQDPEDLNNEVQSVAMTVQSGKKCDFDGIMKLKKFLKDHNVAIVHSHDALALKYGTMAAFLSGKKSLTTVHADIKQNIPRFLWNRNSFIVPASEDLGRQIPRVSREKIKVVYDGLNLEEFDTDFDKSQIDSIKTKHGINSQSLVIGNFASCIPEEDQASLVKMFRKLIAKKMPAELVIVGDGPAKGELENLIQSFDCSSHVKFIHGNGSFKELLNMVDIFILTTNAYSRPMSILKAMAASKPVIVTKIGSHPEIIVENKTGYLVPCGFPERIEQAVMKLKAIPTLLGEIGSNARKHVEDNFTIKHTVRAYEQLYKTMI